MCGHSLARYPAAVSFISLLTCPPPHTASPSFPIRLPFLSWNTFCGPPKVQEGSNCKWTPPAHTPTSLPLTLTAYISLHSEAIAIRWCLLALFVSGFFFLLCSQSEEHFSQNTELVVSGNNDSKRECVSACLSALACAYGQQSLALSSGQLLCLPLRQSRDWVHYSVGVCSSCERSEKASCTACVVAPPALTSVGNEHKILQSTKTLTVTHIWTDSIEALLSLLLKSGSLHSSHSSLLVLSPSGFVLL